MLEIVTCRYLSVTRVLCLAFWVVLFSFTPSQGSGNLFVIVAKSVSDQNFVRVFTGARDEAEKYGDQVILVGGKGEAHFRHQDAEVSSVLKRKPQGLAISVLRSSYLAENSFVAVRKAGIPVVTFDSDFNEGYSALREGYIGTDNEKLGFLLAMEARNLRPQGGTFAIVTGGPDDTNLDDRIRGVLNGLVDTEPRALWEHYKRSPLPCRDDPVLALHQLERLMEDPDVDAIISVGWWAQLAENYEAVVSRYKPIMESREKILIFAGGAPVQLKHLRSGLSHVNIGLDFEAMGRQAYLSLKTLSEGGTVPSIYHTPVRIYRSDGTSESRE